MDAREYLNRQGVGLDRDQERPNTLEEKAWERARGSGNQRPNSGTPHDWEDWEHYHADLAEGAETLEQKIDKEAHRKALAHEKEQAEHAQTAVGHFTPPAHNEPSGQSPPSSATVTESSTLLFAYRALAVLLPPMAVGLTEGGAVRVAISSVLTLMGWLPGVVYAFIWLNKR
ncbi:YqaE/Pmp3 family membrane protein [Vreelandella nigrificans]|uniref:YqaE/Pmp3 family membrane protein n=1 Tax=Vreelandella nigrificans TaxID=2042704 RepID=A0A2A4HP35_9GAMM|nr:YqaE/Pmp3 family membrane protein [Halomonas nigrificans]PCF95804.1 YqaE/Pmp3 family membrane protein [Halomonas nigrificans]